MEFEETNLDERNEEDNDDLRFLNDIKLFSPNKED